MKKENELQRSDVAPQLDQGALDKAQKEFDEAYRKWLSSPIGERSSPLPKLKDYINRVAGVGEFSKQDIDKSEKKEVGAEELGDFDFDAFSNANSQWLHDPRPENKPRREDFFTKK